MALEIFIFRRPRLLWVWNPGGGLRAFGVNELEKILTPPKARTSEHALQGVEFKAWQKSALEFTVSYVVRKEDDLGEHTAQLRWESATDTIRVQSVRLIK